VAITRSAVLLSMNGIDFRIVSPPSANAEVYGLVATDHKTLLAATSTGLMRSEDFGASWQTVAGVLDGNTVSAICKHPARPGVFFAACHGAVFGSVNDGRSWTRITDGEISAIKELVVADGIPSRLLAITHSQGVYAVVLDSLLTKIDCRDLKCEAHLDTHHR
jgi:hypothetical protein